MSFVALMVAESSGGFDEMKDFKSWRDLKLESMVLTWGMKAAIFFQFLEFDGCAVGLGT